MFVIFRMLTSRIGIGDLTVAGVLLLALLLSFSRGAWFHFAVSSLVLVALAFFTAPTPHVRLRVVALSALSFLALALLLAILLSFDFDRRDVPRTRTTHSIL